jgi:competence protein ComEA
MGPQVSKGSPRPARGGRLAPLWSAVWLPVVCKGAVALAAVVVLAFVGASVGANPPAAAAVTTNPTAPSDAAAAGTASASSAAPAPAPVPADGGAPIGPGILPDGRVVLNAADEQALRTLPGVGPKRAQAILTLRHRLVRFRRVEDLLRVKGIGRKTLSKIKPKVVLSPPG